MAAFPLRYHVAIDAYEFQIREAKGREHICKPFELELKFVLADSDRVPVEGFDPYDVVKKDAVVLMRRGTVVERRITGIIQRVTVSATAQGVPEVVMTLTPRLSLLTYRQDVRIHRNMTAPEIVTEVCEALGVKIDNRLTESYPSRPYCVQWRETDFNYVSRLLEDEGIFYFIDQNGVMVLGDSVGAYDTIGGNPVLEHKKLAGASEQEDAVFEFGRKASLQPGKVTLRDWHVDRPSLDMDVSSDTADTQGPEWYDYPGEYEEPSEGARKAKLHAEAFSRQASYECGATTCARFYPGAVFTLEDTMSMRSGQYVIRSFVHDFQLEDEGFAADFDADRADIIYRPARDTYVPRILNPHTGVVTVTYPGEDIHCNEKGHVKIHHHWDRLQPYDDSCSHWVPVLQDNTGGSSAIPREGWEMAIHYMEGDPDRPVVLGRVYNGEDMFEEKLPIKKTRSALRSNTSPTREGANQIRFEDLKGTEQIYVHAEKDQNIETANDRNARIGNCDVGAVDNNQQVSITGNAKWNIGEWFITHVGGNQTWKVGTNRKWECQGAYKGQVDGDRTSEVTDFTVEAKDGAITKADELEETFNSNYKEECTKIHSWLLKGKTELTVEGSLIEEIKSSKIRGAGEEKIEKITGNVTQTADGEHKIRCDKKRTTNVTGTCTVKATKALTLTGFDKFTSISPKSTYTNSREVVLKVKDTVITMKDGVIKIDAPESIKLIGSSTTKHNATTSTQNC